MRLATADRLANCIALCCVVAWRVSWLTMLSREAPAADPAAVFTDAERYLLVSATPRPYAARLDGWACRQGMRSSMRDWGCPSRMARRVSAR